MTHDRNNHDDHAAEQDGPGVTIRLAQDPGQAGVNDKVATAKLLHGFKLSFKRETGDKVLRAGPVAAQAQVGNVRLVRGPWNAEFVKYLHAFPTTGVPDDDVDTLSQAYQELYPPGPRPKPVAPVVAPIVSPYAT
mgnify:CR=1 FL=1